MSSLTLQFVFDLRLTRQESQTMKNRNRKALRSICKKNNQLLIFKCKRFTLDLKLDYNYCARHNRPQLSETLEQVFTTRKFLSFLWNAEPLTIQFMGFI